MIKTADDAVAPYFRVLLRYKQHGHYRKTSVAKLLITCTRNYYKYFEALQIWAWLSQAVSRARNYSSC